MNTNIRTLSTPCIAIMLTIGALPLTAVQAADTPAGKTADRADQIPPGWPREHRSGEARLILYQPQVDSWKDYSRISFRAAFELVAKDDAQPQYGVLAVEANTLVDHEARVVLMTGLQVDTRFPGVGEERQKPLGQLAEACLPDKQHISVSLDEVLAYMHPGGTRARTADVSLAPPVIFHSATPGILLTYLGKPQFKPVSGTKLMFAVNTNWVVLMDMASGTYYLQDGNAWLTAPDPVKGPWTATEKLPEAFDGLPDDDGWKDVRKAIPAQPAKVVSKVFGSTQPAELIVTEGEPKFTPISGTRLMYVTNTNTPLFMDLIDTRYYCLIAGRWFCADGLNGPWRAATTNLPADFARIPRDNEMAFVLASVPKTQEAQDAVLLANVPHKATINITEATVNVAYEGKPRFEPIPNTSMKYAVNTAYQVILAEGRYYCCWQGVWFVSDVATGPWSACTSVPKVIYTIPSSSPLYNVTYVVIYETTPDTVVVGYTSGYSGEYVAATGTLMFGAGMIVGAALAEDWHQVNPCFYSYGCSVRYSYSHGGYYRAGAVHYGPHGGAGWGAASYNASTGTWARAGYAYGPSGARWGAQAYNPFTNTYAARAGGTNGYRSWGKTAVSHDGQWAQGGHVSGPRGSAGYVANSSGEWATGRKGEQGGRTLRASGGDVYAGKDGNVYKKSDGQWQKYSGDGKWEKPSWNGVTPHTPPTRTTRTSIERETSTTLNRDSWARERGSSNSVSSRRPPSGRSSRVGGRR